MYDLKAPADFQNQWRRIPRVAWQALQMVWTTSPRHLLLVIGLQVLMGGAIGAQLFVGRDALGELLTTMNTGAGIAPLVPELATLVAMTLVMAVMGSLLAQQQALMGELTSNHTYDQIIEVAASVDLACFEDPAFFDELTRARASGHARSMDIVNGITTLAMALIASLGIGIALFTMHVLLLPLVLLASMPLLIATLINSRQAYQFEYQWTPRNRQLMYLRNLLTFGHTAKEIRVFSATDFLRRRYEELLKERLGRMRAYLRDRLKIGIGGALGTSLGAVIALAALLWLTVNERIDVATALTAAVAMQLLSGRLKSLVRGIGSLVEAGMFFDDYQSFLARLRGVTRPAAGRVGGGDFALHSLQLDSVSFHYPATQAPVLREVSLEVRQGEVVALVGENGSGKTTLVKLILQLYQPDAGRIRWDGIDARGLDPELLRSQLTVIFQDFIQYHLTARDNIVLGRSSNAEDDASVREAAERAGAHAFISRLEEGYDTQLGREFYGGQELSIGQWQRLALARAFFRGGSFIILDEPTASLDPRAEHELFSQIRGLTKGRSVLLISHRFSSVRTADRIYVLQDGRITESGTHTELIALGGHYAELFTLQASAYLGEAPLSRA